MLNKSVKKYQLFLSMIAKDNFRTGKEDDCLILVRTCYRPLSILITPFFLFAGFTANQVTLASISCLLIAFALNITFGVNHIGLAALFIFIWALLDHCDGNIARFHKSESKEGDFLDTLGGYLFLFLLPVSFLLLDKSSIIHSSLSSYAGLLIMGTSGLPILARLVYQKAIGYRSSNNNLAAQEHFGVGKYGKKKTFSRIYRLYSEIFDPCGFFPYILLIASSKGASWLLPFLVCYILSQTFLLTYTIFTFYKQLKIG